MEDHEPGDEKKDGDKVGGLVGGKSGRLDDDVGNDCYVVCDRWVEHCRLLVGGRTSRVESWELEKKSGGI